METSSSQLTSDPNQRTHSGTTDSGVPEPSLENCEAMLVCIDSGRFVVVRQDQPQHLWPIDGGWERLRRLQPGDPVVYNGHRTVIRAIDVYR